MAASLTGIFAPGSPALIESLRTLVLEPDGSVVPGEAIRAAFSFTNFGGAAATGVRVRFTQPRGIEHVSGGDLVDERLLEGGASFIDANGAEIGTLGPNERRLVVCAFRVDATIEDGSELLFQAALATDQTPLVASNIERLVVRSRCDLQGGETAVTIASPESPKPGDVLTVQAKIVNSGSSSANDITVVLPAPEHTTYVPQSARIDGRVVTGLDAEPFDYDRMPVVSAGLEPGRCVLLEYQVTIDSPLADGTRIKASGSVGSLETSEFVIASREILVHSPVDFSGEETVLDVLCDDIVTPGMRVPIALRATNAGTGPATRVQVSFVLPEGLIYAPGSAHLDGSPVSDDAIHDLVFSPGSIGAGRSIEAGFTATVAVPSAGITALPVETALRWRSGERRFVRRLTVRVASRFGRARNFVEADRAVVQAREEITFTVHCYNDGTASEDNVRLRLMPGLHLDDIRVSEGGDETAVYTEPLDLGTVQPHVERVFTVIARAGARVPDRSGATLGVILEHDCEAIDLGMATVIVRSRPTIEAARWELMSQDALRPGGTVDAIVAITNGGTDLLHDARVTLSMPPDLAMERAVDARRERDAIVFADIAPGAAAQARITLRMLRPVAAGTVLAVEGSVIGKGTNRLRLEPLAIVTFCEAQFARSAQMIAMPAQSVNCGDRLRYEIRLRNDGDGPAERLTIHAMPTNFAVYVPSSTSINAVALTDDSGISQLWSKRGLVLAEINPNVELRVAFEMVVMSPLAAGTLLESGATIEWSSETLEVAAPSVRVVATPSLGDSSTGTPISIAQIFAADAPISVPEAQQLQAHAKSDAPPEPEIDGVPDAQPEETEVPPRDDEEPPRAIAEMIASQPLPLAVPVVRTPVLYVDFSPERVTNLVRMIERSDAGGILQHLFAMRMLFPDHAAGAPAETDAAFARAAAALRVPLERLFVRLRMPRLSVSGKDIEDRESRDALRQFVADATSLCAAEPPLRGAGVLRIEGSIDCNALERLAAELDTAPLGAVTPWLTNVALLGSATDRDGERSGVLRAYRDELFGVFSVLNDLPIEEFHRVLTSSVNRRLDESLAEVLGALRGAAHSVFE